jgi:cysteine-rich repeat protein
LALASDNGYKIILNGTTIVDKLSTQFNYGSAVSLNGSEQTAFKNAMVNGENTLDIVVRNMSYPGGPSGNPAGLLFRLNIQRTPAECEADSAFQRACRSWTLKDLGPGDTFWNFGDVKPGDRGTNVISLHVASNDAYVCLLKNNVQNLENGLVDPEIALGDDASTGELSQYMMLYVWEDLNGDGAHQSGEAVLFTGNFDGLNGGINKLSVAGNGNDNFGIAWCMGGLTVNDDGTFSCDGSGNQDRAQTDRLLADLVLYAVQQRNNENFTCVSVSGNCGNGLIEGIEQCDDGNQVNTDACTNSCRLGST